MQMVHWQQVQLKFYDPFSFQFVCTNVKIVNNLKNIVVYRRKSVESIIDAIPFFCSDDHDTHIAMIFVIYEWQYWNNFWPDHEILSCVLINSYAEEKAGNRKINNK